MHAYDVLRYGHRTLHLALDAVPAQLIEQPGACGVWSVRQIIAHLASYEVVLVDVLATAREAQRAPALDQFIAMGMAYNDEEVAARDAIPLAGLIEEFDAAHQQTLDLVSALSPELLRQSGTIPWYGEEYAIDDLIVYQYYGHKREHAAQIEAFRDAAERPAAG